MRKLKTMVKFFTFPAALCACIGWIAVFVIVGMKMPNENAGKVTLLAVSCFALMFPWMTLVLGVLRRLGAGHDDPASEIVPKP